MADVHLLFPEQLTHLMDISFVFKHTLHMHSALSLLSSSLPLLLSPPPSEVVNIHDQPKWIQKPLPDCLRMVGKTCPKCGWSPDVVRKERGKQRDA